MKRSEACAGICALVLAVGCERGPLLKPAAGLSKSRDMAGTVMAADSQSRHGSLASGPAPPHRRGRHASTHRHREWFPPGHSRFAQRFSSRPQAEKATAQFTPPSDRGGGYRGINQRGLPIPVLCGAVLHRYYSESPYSGEFSGSMRRITTRRRLLGRSCDLADA